MWDLINHVICLVFGKVMVQIQLVLTPTGKGKAKSPRLHFGATCLGSNPCPLFTLRDHRLSLTFGVGPDSISLYLFVKNALSNEPLVSRCSSQMDEELFCY